MAVVGAGLLLARPVVGVLLLAAALPLSWTGHHLFETNSPAFFDAPESTARGAGPSTKLEVALGGVMWSVVCPWRTVARRA